MKLVLIVISLMIVNDAQAGIRFKQKHNKVIAAITNASNKVDVPAIMMLTLCFGESNFRTGSKITHMDGSSLSHGICQVKLSTAKWLDKVYKHKNKITAKQLNKPSVNALYAAKYLKKLVKDYDNDWGLALDAYNKGTAVSSNSKYVKRFKKNLNFMVFQLYAAGE